MAAATATATSKPLPCLSSSTIRARAVEAAGSFTASWSAPSRALKPLGMADQSVPPDHPRYNGASFGQARRATGPASANNMTPSAGFRDAEVLGECFGGLLQLAPEPSLDYVAGFLGRDDKVAAEAIT